MFKEFLNSSTLAPRYMPSGALLKSVLVLGSMGWAGAAHATELQVPEEWVGQPGNKTIVSMVEFSLEKPRKPSAFYARCNPNNELWTSEGRNSCTPTAVTGNDVLARYSIKDVARYRPGFKFHVRFYSEIAKAQISTFILLMDLAKVYPDVKLGNFINNSLFSAVKPQDGNWEVRWEYPSPNLSNKKQ